MSVVATVGRGTQLDLLPHGRTQWVVLNDLEDVETGRPAGRGMLCTFATESAARECVAWLRNDGFGGIGNPDVWPVPLSDADLRALRARLERPREGGAR